MPQLAAIRTIAVLGVLNIHWLMKFGIGGIGGVILFFVLSGFLITTILLNEKYKLSSNSGSRFSVIKNFIVRRTLRIFPIYYLYILFFCFAGDPYIRLHWPWYFSYCSNIYFFKIQSMDTALYNHTWSLAVEEQFYLFWPWLILFVPRKNESKLIISMILFAVLVRVVLVMNDMSALNNISLTPSILDAFGLGALLAYLRLNAGALGKFDRFYVLLKNNYLFFIFIPLGISFYLFYSKSQLAMWLFPVFFPLVYSLFSMSFIYKAAVGFTGYARYFFDNNIILYIGKISYGIYLYHKAVPWFYKWVCFKTGLVFPVNTIAVYCIYLTTVLLISGLSWFFLEKRINNFKHLFNYS